VAAGRGSAVAVREERGGYSYQTLRATVRTVARVLRQAGVRPGDVVAVPAQRSALLVPALIGTLAAGGRLLMLDTGHPAARLADHIATARPRCLMLVEPDSLGHPLVAATSCAVVALTSAGPARVLRREDPDHTPTNLGGAGYVAFTSGTTGTPAAVTAGLGPIAHFLHWYTARFRIGPADRFSLLAGVSHDPLFRDVLTPLWAGALLCVPDADTLRSPAELLAWLHREQITVMHLTPPLARLLLDAAAATPVVLSSLRLVCLAGDLVTSADVTRLSALAANAVLINGYGTTETPQLASWQLLRPGATPALGAGAPGSQLLVVDPEGELCAIGEPGHIVVRSRHLVEGLLNAADRGNALSPDEVPGVRRFRTGDLGRYQVDGSVAFLGRSDTVVKVRGFRVNPAEVDLALADDQRIVTSLTTSAAGPDGTELISYVVGGGGPVNVTALRNRLAGLLPAYLLPTTIVLVDRLPLTVNGKVDAAAVGRAAAVTASGSILEAPKGPLEWRLARIWTTVLGTEQVSVTDSFFDLGGTSLSMVRLHAAICREVHDRLPLLALYQNPSIRALAQYLASGAEQPSRAIRSRQSPAGERSRRLSSRRGLGL
jgi:amino acid adenylation domain-containing protein